MSSWRHMLFSLSRRIKATIQRLRRRKLTEAPCLVIFELWTLCRWMSSNSVYGQFLFIIIRLDGFQGQREYNFQSPAVDHYQHNTHLDSILSLWAIAKCTERNGQYYALHVA